MLEVRERGRRRRSRRRRSRGNYILQDKYGWMSEAADAVVISAVVASASAGAALAEAAASVA